MSSKLPDFQQRLKSPIAHVGSDHGQSRYNREVRESLQRVNEKIDYQLIDVAVATTATQVTHNLGRPWKGWDIWDQDANTNIWRVVAPSGSPSDDSKYIYLQAGSAVNIRLMIL